MKRDRRTAHGTQGARTEQVGTKHDSVQPCALCTVMLAEGVTGEGWPTGSILDTPELRDWLDVFHAALPGGVPADNYAGRPIVGARTPLRDSEGWSAT